MGNGEKGTGRSGMGWDEDEDGEKKDIGMVPDEMMRGERRTWV